MTDTLDRTDVALADIPLARDLVPQDRRLLPCSLEDLNVGADVIQAAGGFVDQKLRQDRGACVAVAYMAALHGTDLIGTASQAYNVGGRLAFMAQFINALLQRHLEGNPEYAFEGAGATRQVRVTATPKGGKPLSYTSPQMGQIKVKNSPLWLTDPDQQLGYMAIRAWARRHKPDVLLGIYAVEELQAITIRDVTPPPPADLDGDALAPEIEDAEVEGDQPFEPSGGFTTDAPQEPYRASSAAHQQAKADDPLEWAECVKQDIDDCADEAALDALFEATETNRRALFAADKAASRDLDDRFTQRQKELRAAG
jgi:hypothetical protein